MALSDSFRKVAVYFGLAEDREYYDDDEPDAREPETRAREPLPGAPERAAPAVAPPPRRDRRHLRRRLAVRAPDRAAAARSAAPRPSPPTAEGSCACTSSSPRRTTTPRIVADKFKQSIPVILNLQSSDADALDPADRLRVRPHVRARRRHAEDRREGLPAHAAQRRGVGGRARGVDREGLFQPVVGTVARWHPHAGSTATWRPARRSPTSCGALILVYTLIIFASIIVSLDLLVRRPRARTRARSTPCSTSCATSRTRTCGSSAGSGSQFGPIDFSPIVAILVLQLGGGLIVNLIHPG